MNPTDHLAPVNLDHTHCSHPKGKKARAACRRRFRLAEELGCTIIPLRDEDGDSLYRLIMDGLEGDWVDDYASPHGAVIAALDILDPTWRG